MNLRIFLSLFNTDTPLSPTRTRKGVTEILHPQGIAWINSTLSIPAVLIGQNKSEERYYDIDFSENFGRQFLTSWYEEEFDDLPLRRRIQNKLVSYLVLEFLKNAPIFLPQFNCIICMKFLTILKI